MPYNLLAKSRQLQFHVVFPFSLRVAAADPRIRRAEGRLLTTHQSRCLPFSRTLLFSTFPRLLVLPRLPLVIVAYIVCEDAIGVSELVVSIFDKVIISVHQRVRLIVQRGKILY